MKLRNKVILAGAAICASTVALAPSALADGNPGDCGSGKACIWTDIHYSTNGSRFSHLDASLYRGTLPSGYDREGSSAYNHGTARQGVYFYKNQRCASGGARFKMEAGNGDSDFTNGSPSGNFQDAVRSYVFDSMRLISQCQAS